MYLDEAYPSEVPACGCCSLLCMMVPVIASEDAIETLPSTTEREPSRPLLNTTAARLKTPSARVLPIALLAALAMASTSATAFFAYATLLCADPPYCTGSETSRYAGSVAITTSVANVLGLISLGLLQRISSTYPKSGLMLWLICRSMSAVMLLIGGWLFFIHRRTLCIPDIDSLALRHSHRFVRKDL